VAQSQGPVPLLEGKNISGLNFSEITDYGFELRSQRFDKSDLQEVAIHGPFRPL
jgi:hypothetical protein